MSQGFHIEAFRQHDEMQPSQNGHQIGQAGDGDEIEYSITYTYEVIDGLLHFSSNDDQTFIFRPSDKKYLKGSIDIDEIIQLEGCTFL